MSDETKLTIRVAARNRRQLGGTDAQALEAALQQVERELAASRAEVAALRTALAFIAEHGRHSFDREQARRSLDTPADLSLPSGAAPTLDPQAIREGMLSVVRMNRDLQTAREELATARARLHDNDAAGALRRLDAYFASPPDKKGPTK